MNFMQGELDAMKVKKPHALENFQLITHGFGASAIMSGEYGV